VGIAAGGPVRLVMSALLVGTVLVTAAPSAGAVATQAAATRISAHATPPITYIGSTVVVAGAVRPVVAGASVILQRLVGRRWVAVVHQHLSRTGRYSFAVRVPGTAQVRAFRVVRGATAAAKAGVSAKLTVRVTKSRFAVRATAAGAQVDSGHPIVLAGLVTPKAGGPVVLQELTGRTWHNIAQVRLTAHST
jgi:hypothetical protein